MKKRYRLAASLFLIVICMAMAAIAVEMPQFQSGVSEKAGMDVDFNTLYSKANAIYDVVEHDDNHIIWKFSQTTGDWVFVNKDGTIAIASTSGMNLAIKDKLNAELNDVYSTIKAAKGTISGTDGPITIPINQRFIV